jgi:outer membrane receptor protein involved in Fe transport
MKSDLRRHTTVLGACVLAVLASAAASAQAQSNEAGSGTDKTTPPVRAEALQEIVVTGSRIAREAIQDGSIPVTAVGIEQLIDQGDINLGDALNDLPSLRSTFSQGNSGRFIGTAGVNWLDLRGLGTSRTLVLVNGRRHVTSSPGDYLIDVNSIPSDLIERVDVVTGGNSAVYGSDAVAGVVNFITMRNYEGVKFKGQLGQSKYSDRDSGYFSVVAGQNFADGRGNVAGSFEYAKTDALYYKQRDGLTGAYSGRSQFNLSSDTTLDGPTGSDGIIDNLFYHHGIFNANIADGGWLYGLNNTDGHVWSFDANGNLCETVPETDFRPYGSGNIRISSNPCGLSSLRNTGQLAAGLERYSANLLAHYDVSDAVRPFIEAKFVHIEAIQEGQPSFIQYGPLWMFGAGDWYRCDNPFLKPEDLATIQSLGRCSTPSGILYMSRFNVDFGGRGELQDRDTFRIVAGVEGTFNDDWRYEISANYGRLDTHLRSLNNLVAFDLDGNPDGILLAADAVRNSSGQIVCRVNADSDPTNDRPDCVPINLFGIGSPSPEALAFVNTTAIRNEKAEQMVATAYMSGDTSQWFELPGGPLGFAAGTEYRIEKAESVWDELTASGGTFMNAIQPFTPPDMKVADVFAELRFPILVDSKFAQELTVETAGRISDYNTDTGRVSAYNVGLIYAPVSEVRLRANYSTSVRAPTQSDLYSPQSQNYAFISDPCDVLYINNNPNRPANCAAAGIAPGFVNQPARDASTSYSSGGNPTLTEEKGKSYTIGAILTPSFWPGFAFSVDYYNIKVNDLIASLGAQTILNECYNAPGGINNPYCATVNRNPDGTFADPAVISGGVNYAKQETEGIDFDLSYTTRFDDGQKLTARTIATYVLKINNYTNPSDPTISNRQLSELGDPALAFNFNLGYSYKDFDLSYNLRYIGKQTIGTYESMHSWQGNPPTNADQYPRTWYPSRTYHGIRGQFAMTDKVKVYVGVDNLTNAMPPLGLLGTAGGDPFDSIGRYYYTGVIVEM